MCKHLPFTLEISWRSVLPPFPLLQVRSLMPVLLAELPSLSVSSRFPPRPVVVGESTDLSGDTAVGPNLATAAVAISAMKCSLHAAA